MADKPKTPWRLAAIGSALVVATLITYARGLNAGFLFWDDDKHITQNYFIRALDVENLRVMLTTTHANNWHPVTWLSHALTYQLFGLDPWGHHFVSVLIHCFNALWVFALALVLMGLASRGEHAGGWPLRASRPLVVGAAAAALLFGVHPQHVESVVWIAERKDVLFLFFLLPCLLAYTFYAHETSPRRRRAWFLASFVCFGLSVGSKSMAVTTPIVLLLMDVYPLHRTPLTQLGRRAGANWRGVQDIIVEKLPFFAIALLVGLFAVVAQGDAVVELERIGPTYRVLNATNSVVLYIAKWAVPIQLSPYYTYPPLFGGFFATSDIFLLAIVVVVATTTLAVYGWRLGQPLWLVLWFFYLVTLAPVLGIVTVGYQSSADRYAYLPTLPLYLLAGYGVSNAFHREWTLRPARWAIALCFAGIVGLLAYMTYQQSGVWLNDVTFWQRIEREATDPQSRVVHAGLAKAYRESREFERAVPHHRTALESDPNDVAQRHDFALTLLALNRPDEALKVLPATEDGLPKGALASLLSSVGHAYCGQGRRDEARRLAKRALEIDSMCLGASQLLGRVKAGACY